MIPKRIGLVGIPLLYGATYLAALFGPEIAKILVTGTSGPDMHFAATAIICPIVFISLGLIGGRRLVAIHAALLAIFVLFSWASYPENPPMNFTRQIAHELPLGIIQASFARSWLFLS